MKKERRRRRKKEESVVKHKSAERNLGRLNKPASHMRCGANKEREGGETRGRKERSEGNFREGKAAHPSQKFSKVDVLRHGHEQTV